MGSTKFQVLETDGRGFVNTYKEKDSVARFAGSEILSEFVTQR
jgi:hypothetical protein